MKCPNCGFIEKDEVFGSPAICPQCDAIYEKALRAQELKEQMAVKAKPAPSRIAAVAAGVAEGVAESRKERQEAEATDNSARPTKVIITDINMPFWSLVGFMIKFALAAIPAFFIIALIVTGVPAFFGTLLRL